MSAHFFKSGECRGIVHLANIYRYGGFTFEWHYWCGPILCRKDMEPRKVQPSERHPFWAVLERWQKLTTEEKEATRIYG